MRVTYILFILFVVVLIVLRGTLAINLSESIPRGLYLQSGTGNLERGDLILFHNEMADRIGAERGYKRPGAMLGKRIAAIAGDTIQVSGAVRVNGRMVGKPALERDTAGRPLSPFIYRGVVPQGQLLVLGETENSFDSRYYGLIETGEVTSKLKPLVTWR